jgi:DNA-binding beta-propeller fold protein YncE
MSRIALAVSLVALVAAMQAAVAAPTTYRFDKAWGEYGSGDGQLNSPMRLNIRGNALLVADRDNDRVQMFDLNGRFLRKFGTQGYGRDNLRNTFEADFDADGNVYIADFANGRILKRTFEFAYLGMWGMDGTGVDQFQGPRGLAVDGDKGILYVADTLNDRISKWTLNGVHIGYFGRSGTGPGEFDSPYDVACGSTSVYVADTENNRIQQFALNGRFLRQWNHSAGGSTLLWPPALTVAPNGTVFVCDGDNNRIVQYSATGGLITTFGRFGSGPGEFDMPGGVAVDAVGRVYVANAHGHHIERFRPNSPPTRPTSLTIIPSAPTDDNQLTARASGSTDPDGDPVTYRYQWQASSDSQTWTIVYTQRLLPANRTQAGKWYRFRASASDGAVSSAWATSASVQVRAALPRLAAASAQQVAGGAIALTVTLADGAMVDAEVLNLAGKVVAIVTPRALDAGTASFTLNAVSTLGTRLPAGAYMVKLTARSASGWSSSRVAPLMLRAPQGS